MSFKVKHRLPRTPTCLEPHPSQNGTPRPFSHLSSEYEVTNDWNAPLIVTASEIEVIEQFLGKSLDQLLSQWQAETRSATTPKKSADYLATAFSNQKTEPPRD